jgi:hypothetical protein
MMGWRAGRALILGLSRAGRITTLFLFSVFLFVFMSVDLWQGL